MKHLDETFITTQDLMFVGVLNDIKKSKTSLQPIFEAFTNAIEAIKIRTKLDSNFKGEITVKINSSINFAEDIEFQNLVIEDNGIGFSDEEFRRFNTFKDFTKGYKNLGSGRIQYAHYFDNTEFVSVFKEGNDYFERNFIVSKDSKYLAKNAIVFHKYCKKINPKETGTRIIFNSLLEHSNIYDNLNAEQFKEVLIERYVHYFCYNKDSIPKIHIKYYEQSELKGETNITKNDIPKIEKTDFLDLTYSKIPAIGNVIEKTDKSERFTIDSFKIKKDLLKSNDLKLVSKGEIIEDSNVSLSSLAENDNIKGFKYLFLISSNYIDERDTNIRGVLNIPDKESFLKSNDIFSNEEIVLEDIQEGVNEKIKIMYPEIEEVKKKHDEQFTKLKEMFLLDDETANNIKISINDTESKILEKFYEAEAKKAANIDASIKASIDKLDNLDTRSDNYNELLKQEVDKLVKTIPLQNKTTLTHYVARRKLVLDLFEKILDRKLTTQINNTSNYDEALIHNLLFQQQSKDSENSDLWIINEDFIYFKGSSEKQLSKLEINGKKVFKSKFTEEEDKYLLSLGENRKIKRPDVLLFPEEGKCIIIEFKTPDANVADHLTQINLYASLMRNYSEDDFQITTFYGYLIGESIEPNDVMGRVSSFEYSYHLDYLFKPSEKVKGFDGKSDGSIYTEVIKYSTLLERARKRNKIFIDKLNS